MPRETYWLWYACDDDYGFEEFGTFGQAQDTASEFIGKNAEKTPQYVIVKGTKLEERLP